MHRLFSALLTCALLAWVSPGAQASDLLDFGDAPDPTYPTLLASDGARHTIVYGTGLGESIDYEADGQPNLQAEGDDLGSPLADEDGVAFTSLLVPGLVTTVDITGQSSVLLDAWIDFDGSGSWDANEQIFINTPIAPGLNEMGFLVPASALEGATYARFRVSTTGGLAPVGLAENGEVEDYRVNITPEPATLAVLATGGMALLRRRR